jgi:hypothetical protein
MKDWAMEKGATHYAHVFYPLTGLTAEKHDSFMEPVGDGTAIWEFPARSSSRASRTRRRSPTVASAPRSRPWLHRLGRPVAGVHPREPQRLDPLHPDDLRLDDR